MSGKRSNRLRFSLDENEGLIKAMSKYPCLYDLKHKYYHDHALRDSLWALIAQEINKSVADCKTRWKCLKNEYRKRQKEMSDGSTKRHCTSIWEHMDSMKFLDGDISCRSTPAAPKPKKVELSDRSDFVNIQMLRDANEEEEEEETEVEESEIKIEMDEMDVEELSINNEKSDREMNGAATPSTSSHVEEPGKESSAAARHPLQIFFDSMARTTMSFPPPLAVRAKTEVLEVISKLELEMWNM